MNQHTLRNTVQHSATRCNTVQHSATHCNPGDTKETCHTIKSSNTSALYGSFRAVNASFEGTSGAYEVPCLSDAHQSV